MNNVVPIVWAVETDPMLWTHGAIQIHKHRKPDEFGEGFWYAIRGWGQCLNKEGKWVHEPLPSSRNARFFAQCRFDTLEEAAIMVNQVLEKEKPS